MDIGRRGRRRHVQHPAFRRAARSRPGHTGQAAQLGRIDGDRVGAVDPGRRIERVIELGNRVVRSVDLRHRHGRGDEVGAAVLRDGDRAVVEARRVDRLVQRDHERLHDRVARVRRDGVQRDGRRHRVDGPTRADHAHHRLVGGIGDEAAHDGQHVAAIAGFVVGEPADLPLRRRQLDDRDQVAECDRQAILRQREGARVEGRDRAGEGQRHRIGRNRPHRGGHRRNAADQGLTERDQEAGGGGVVAGILRRVLHLGAVHRQRVVAGGIGQRREPADAVDLAAAAGRARIGERHAIQRDGGAVLRERQRRGGQAGRVERLGEGDVDGRHGRAQHGGREVLDRGDVRRLTVVVDEVERVRPGAVEIQQVHQVDVQRARDGRREHAVGAPHGVARHHHGAVGTDDLDQLLARIRVGDGNVVPARGGREGQRLGVAGPSRPAAGRHVGDLLRAALVADVQRVRDGVAVGRVADGVLDQERGHAVVGRLHRIAVIADMHDLDQRRDRHALDQRGPQAAVVVLVGERSREVGEAPLQRGKQLPIRRRRLARLDGAEVDGQAAGASLVLHLRSDDLEVDQQPLLVLDDLRL